MFSFIVFKIVKSAAEVIRLMKGEDCQSLCTYGDLKRIKKNLSWPILSSYCQEVWSVVVVHVIFLSSSSYDGLPLKYA
jgi:hypothetical protein